MRFTRKNTSVFNISYHIIWCPKYRKRVLTRGVDDYVKSILLAKALELGCEIKNMEVMPDHIHIFIKANPEVKISWLVKMLKGQSSYMTRKKFTFLKRYKSLWTRSYYCETIGHISENTIKKYIDNQKLF